MGKNFREKITELAEGCRDDKELADIVVRDLQSMCGYVDAVCAMEYQLPIIRACFEGQEVRDRTMALDETRWIAHERAIMGVKRLNRFSHMMGLKEPFYPGDTEDRHAVGDFCGTMVNELFEGRSVEHDITRLEGFREEFGMEGDER